MGDAAPHNPLKNPQFSQSHHNTWATLARHSSMQPIEHTTIQIPPQSKDFSTTLSAKQWT